MIMRKKLITRQPMVVESAPGSVLNTQQLLLLSPEEAAEIRRQFPYLVVRAAENQDKAQWALSPELFNDRMPTHHLQVLPDEIRARMARARKARKPSVVSHLSVAED
jgi:hypothetical protein